MALAEIQEGGVIVLLTVAHQFTEPTVLLLGMAASATPCCGLTAPTGRLIGVWCNREQPPPSLWGQV